MICTNCALFGQHKGNYIYSEEDIISLLEMKASELTEMVERILKEQQQVSRNKHEGDVSNQVQEMQKNAIEKVKKEFNDLRDKIDSKEKLLVTQISTAAQNVMNKFTDWWCNNVTIEKECQLWICQRDQQNIQTNLSKEQFQKVRRLMVSNFLATCMKKHFDFVSQLEIKYKKGEMDFLNHETTRVLPELIVHTCDYFTNQKN